MNLHEVILGAVLIAPQYAAALAELRIEDFPSELQPVFAAIQGFWELYGRVDAVELCTRYPAQKDALLRCAGACEGECIKITRERVEEWARLIREQSALARFQSIAVRAIDGKAAYSDLPDLYDQMGAALTMETDNTGMQSIGELLDSYLGRYGEKARYIETGIRSLDKFLKLSPGNLFIIGGRPSAGKTALSLQMAVNMAKRGYRVCYFSLETDPATLTGRIIANRLAAPLADVKDSRIPLSDFDALADERDLPLFIHSASGKSVGWIRSQAKRMKAQVVFVDYLQLIADGKGKDRYAQITNISIALHTMAQQTGMLVVALAQLNRNAAHAAPSCADLKESGQLEQDADAVLLLSDDGESYQAILAKNKEGQIGKIHIAFDKPRQRFLELASA